MCFTNVNDIYLFNLPISQHVPLYPCLQEQPCIVGVPELWQLSVLHERVSDKTFEHDPPQDSTTVFFLHLDCIPPVPHCWVQWLHFDQELTWQARGVHGGGAYVLLRQCPPDSVNPTKVSSAKAKTKSSSIHIISWTEQPGTDAASNFVTDDWKNYWTGWCFIAENAEKSVSLTSLTWASAFSGLYFWYVRDERPQLYLFLHYLL